MKKTKEYKELLEYIRKEITLNINTFQRFDVNESLRPLNEEPILKGYAYTILIDSKFNGYLESVSDTISDKIFEDLIVMKPFFNRIKELGFEPINDDWEIWIETIIDFERDLRNYKIKKLLK